MQIDQLPSEAQSKLQELLRGIEEVLKGSKIPHLRVVSDSSMPDGPNATSYNGGSMRAPSKPQPTFDARALRELHRAFLMSAPEMVNGIVVVGQRANAESPWELHAKVISRDDYRVVLEARKLVDEEVERDLRQQLKTDWERVSFGRETADKGPALVYTGPEGTSKREPSPRQLELLKQAEDIYRKAGFDLKIAFWTIKPNEALDFREYFE
jgi:hypothetical protein